jgi:hypothetical protein
MTLISEKAAATAASLSRSDKRKGVLPTVGMSNIPLRFKGGVDAADGREARAR